MKIDEFGIKDLFRAATGNIAGEAELGKRLIKIYPKASTGEILKMISKYKEFQKRGYKDSDIDLLSLGDLDKIDPQILKKQELQQKYSPQDVEKMRQKQDILRRQSKNQKKQQQKKSTPTFTPTPTEPTTPPPNAVLPTKTYGNLIWTGSSWAGDNLRFDKPEDVKRLNKLYFDVQNADRNLEKAKRDSENQKIRLKAYRKVFGN